MATADLVHNTLVITSLPDWVNEMYLYQLFLPTKSVLSVRMARSRSAGGKFAHITFESHETADACWRAYNGTLAPNTNLRLELSWPNDQIAQQGEYSIFVGDLAHSVNDAALLHTFQSPYPSVFEARVMIDLQTQRAKGFGFVRFTDEGERDRAIREMNGVDLLGRPMRISMAARRNGSKADTTSFAPAVTAGDFDPSNTTLFVGGLLSNVSENDLSAVFQAYGHLRYIRIPPNKGCGFVEFVHREAAEAAMHALHTRTLNGNTMRISWGRNHKRTGQQPPHSHVQSAHSHAYHATPSYTAQPPYPQAPDAAAAAAAAWHAYESGYYAGNTGSAAPAHHHQQEQAWHTKGTYGQGYRDEAPAAADAWGGAYGWEEEHVFGNASPSKYNVDAANRRFCALAGGTLRPRHFAATVSVLHSDFQSAPAQPAW